MHACMYECRYAWLDVQLDRYADPDRSGHFDLMLNTYIVPYTHARARTHTHTHTLSLSLTHTHTCRCRQRCVSGRRCGSKCELGNMSRG